MLAERWAQELRRQRYPVPQGRGRPAQPGAEHRRSERRPQQLQLRLATAETAPVWPLPDGGGLQGAQGDATPGDSRNDRAHLLLHGRPLQAAPVKAGSTALPGVEQGLPGRTLGAPAQSAGGVCHGLGQFPCEPSGHEPLRAQAYLVPGVSASWRSRLKHSHASTPR